MDTKWLHETGLTEVELVGGKNASLGEMIRNLQHVVKVPGGFIVTSAAFKRFLAYNALDQHIETSLASLDTTNLSDLLLRSKHIRDKVLGGVFPTGLREEITTKYSEFCSTCGQDVAVRSSGTAEDMPDASFAGQQDTFLNVCGIDAVLDRIRACFASLYTDRAISYRKQMGYTQNVSISVCVQKMVRSDRACSGVAFSIHPDSGFEKVICITGSYGLGELIVGGQVKPDEFLVFKPLLGVADRAPLISKTLGHKTHKMVYADVERTAVVETTNDERDHFCLSDAETLKLAEYVAAIETYYSIVYGRACPVDVEWAMDGESRELYIVQARPETVHSRRKDTVFTEYVLDTAATASAAILCTGISVGASIGAGRVRHVRSIHDEQSLRFEDGDVLVTEYTDPTFEPLMKKAAAIVTDKGGRTSHAAIVSREMGKTAVVGCENATRMLVEGAVVTVSASQGDIGKIFDGRVPFTTNTVDLGALPTLNGCATQIMMNVGNPSDVFKYANFPVAGVGLAREEFIIANTIGVHPNAILYPERVSEDVRASIRERARGYDSERTYYVRKLAEGIARISATFYPRPVIVRFSDFKSNEYRDLLGGSVFEPVEENPMIGFRGCSRYYSADFREAFRMECEAIRYVREHIGLDNTRVMLPFCRTVAECQKTLACMEASGLKRGVHGLQVYLMCEIPSNVILADEFCKYVDGFSIGSNDLTQLCLGLDRDSGALTTVGNETDPAVKVLISMAIRACKRAGVKIGICGQGPSDIPAFADFLLAEGIDSISLIPDSVRDFLVRLSPVEQSAVNPVAESVFAPTFL